MTRQFGNPDAPPRHASSTDVFVIFSVTILSLATGAWLLAQIGVAIWWAMIGALAIYAVLLTLHVMARRSFAALDRAATARTDEDIDWLRGPDETSAAGLPRGTSQSGFSESDFAASDFSPDLSPNLAPDQAPPLGDAALPGHWDIAPTPAKAEPSHALPEPRAADPFDFRPLRTPSLDFPHAELPHAALEDLVESDLPAPDLPAQRRLDDTSEMNVEVIQDLIKKLADELNGPMPPREPEPASEPASASDTEAMIGRSVAALETTARGMRVPPAKQKARPETRQEARLDVRPQPYQEPRQPTGSVPAWWPVATEADAQPKAAIPTSKPPALNPQLARIAEAVAAERLEVLLEPIQALADGRPRHYEVSVRLRTADGATLEQCDFARAAQGSGLLPRIDAERMIRAARVARRLGERGRQGSVMSAFASESLTDADFLAMATAYNGDGRMSLVLSFAQSEVRTFTQGHAEALGRLAAAGFGFALEEVTDLDMDFAGMKAMGFEFVKLDAPVFLEGLPAPGGRVPASDICRHLSDLGLTLIVGRIEDDWLLARILGFGVLFAKGTLFGGPKLVKPEVFAQPAAAA